MLYQWKKSAVCIAIMKTSFFTIGRKNLLGTEIDIKMNKGDLCHLSEQH